MKSENKFAAVLVKSENEFAAVLDSVPSGRFPKFSLLTPSMLPAPVHAALRHPRAGDTMRGRNALGRHTLQVLHVTRKTVRYFRKYPCDPAEIHTVSRRDYFVRGLATWHAYAGTAYGWTLHAPRRKAAK